MATAPYAFNVAPVPSAVPTVGSQFFAGFAVGGGTFANLGLRSATYNAQGFHGVQRSFAAGATSPLPGQNAGEED